MFLLVNALKELSLIIVRKLVLLIVQQELTDILPLDIVKLNVVLLDVLHHYLKIKVFICVFLNVLLKILLQMFPADINALPVVILQDRLHGRIVQRKHVLVVILMINLDCNQTVGAFIADNTTWSCVYYCPSNYYFDNTTVIPRCVSVCPNGYFASN